MSRRQREEDLATLAGVLERLYGELGPGFSTEQGFEIDGLEVRLSISVTRKLTVEKRAELLNFALAWLQRQPYRAEACSCNTQRKQRFGRARARCTKPPVHAVIYEGSDVEIPLSQRRVIFACAVHSGTAIEPAKVVGLVELPRTELAAARSIGGRS